MKLQIIRIPKNLSSRSPDHRIHQSRTLPQSRSQYLIRQISPRLIQRSNRKLLRRRTPAQPPHLRKNKPHPMTPLLPSPQLLAYLLVYPRLRLHKTPQPKPIPTHRDPPPSIPTPPKPIWSAAARAAAFHTVANHPNPQHAPLASPSPFPPSHIPNHIRTPTFSFQQRISPTHQRIPKIVLDSTVTLW
jgi:hypothetical protein